MKIKGWERFMGVELDQRLDMCFIWVFMKVGLGMEKKTEPRARSL